MNGRSLWFGNCCEDLPITQPALGRSARRFGLLPETFLKHKEEIKRGARRRRKKKKTGACGTKVPLKNEPNNPLPGAKGD